MRAASLFSGIGAPEVACPDWQWLWHAEIAPFASAVMAARHPGSINLGDVTKSDFVERALRVGRPDVVVFGSPCQSFSTAGKRGGMADARGNLALVGLEVVRQLGAPWLVFENVPGLLSSDFGAFLGTVAECGHLGCWRVLDAQFAGVPQRRRRVFFVGHLGDWRPAAEILFEPTSLRGDSPPSREAGEDVARLLAAGSPRSSGYRNDCDTAENLIAFDTTQITSKVNRSNPQAGDPSYPLAAKAHAPLIAHSLRADGFDASEDGTGRGTPLVPVPILEAGKRTTGNKANARDGLGIGQAGNPTFTLQAGAQHAIALSMAVRRLTPRECERLQGFPDDWTLIDYRGKPAADGPRYRAIGNSMAVPVVRWILQRLERVAARMAKAA